MGINIISALAINTYQLCKKLTYPSTICLYSCMYAWVLLQLNLACKKIPEFHLKFHSLFLNVWLMKSHHRLKKWLCACWVWGQFLNQWWPKPLIWWQSVSKQGCLLNSMSITITKKRLSYTKQFQICPISTTGIPVTGNIVLILKWHLHISSEANKLNRTSHSFTYTNYCYGYVPWLHLVNQLIYDRGTLMGQLLCIVLCHIILSCGL